MPKDLNPLPEDKSDDLTKEHQDDVSMLSLGDPELEARFISIQKAHDDLELRLNDIFRQMNFTKRSFSDYISNPNNFQSGDWDFLQKRRRENEQKIWDMFGIEGKKPSEKEKDKSTKDRRGKTLGARKNWMPMR